MGVAAATVAVVVATAADTLLRSNNNLYTLLYLFCTILFQLQLAFFSRDK